MRNDSLLVTLLVLSLVCPSKRPRARIARLEAADCRGYSKFAALPSGTGASLCVEKRRADWSLPGERGSRSDCAVRTDRICLRYGGCVPRSAVR